MFRKLFGRAIPGPAGLFNGPFFDVRTLFVLEYDCMPSVSAIGDVDGGCVHAFIRERFDASVLKVWQHSYFDHKDNEVVFSRSIFQLPGMRLIEVGAGYCEVLHDADFTWANGLIACLADFRVKAEEAPIGFARNNNLN
jgi:hypothetical protein